jgi:lipopolysaccharide transport system permease protein
MKAGMFSSTHTPDHPSLEHESVIEPSRGLLAIDWKGVYHYRDLLAILVSRDFTAQYKQTLLGPLWLIIQPILTTVVFTVIFGKVARIPTDGLPPMLFYMCGMVAWGYFSGCLGNTAATFQASAGIFGKVYFPRLIVPLSMVCSRLIAFSVQMALFLVFLGYFKFFTPAGVTIRPGLAVVILPLLIVQSAALGMGVGLWITSLTTKRRDLAFISTFLIQMWMYATPVVYPLSIVPARWKALALANPMTSIVELYRFAFLGVGDVSWMGGVASLVTTAAVLLSGIMIFNRAERTFIDTI